jgi:membrane protease YdiL (CAAX protease family)
VTATKPTRRAASERAAHRDGFVQRRPVAAFLLVVMGIGIPCLAIPVMAGIPTAPFLLVYGYVVLLGSALLITRVADGPGAGRKLLSRVLIWRFGAGRWAVILFALPVITIAVAAVSGTLSTPEDGWATELGWYLVNVFLVGALSMNLWEETAWAGFAQSRLMAGHGLLSASLITAVFFAGIHVPLYFEGDQPGTEIAISLALLFAAAPFYRYLLGMHLLDTRGSLLAVGIQHASWNAATKLDAVDGGTYELQVLAAVVLLTVLLAVGRRLWQPQSRPIGRAAEQAAAAFWTAAPTRPKPATPSSSATVEEATR